MIEDKELGLKVAENPEEALWARVAENTKQRITELENTLIVEKALLETAEKKLKAMNHKEAKPSVPVGVG